MRTILLRIQCLRHCRLMIETPPLETPRQRQAFRHSPPPSSLSDRLSIVDILLLMPRLQLQQTPDHDSQQTTVQPLSPILLKQRRNLQSWSRKDCLLVQDRNRYLVNTIGTRLSVTRTSTSVRIALIHCLNAQYSGRRSEDLFHATPSTKFDALLDRLGYDLLGSLLCSNSGPT